MGLPVTIRVKISSEAAGYVALTPVVVQEIELKELLGHIATAAGKEPEAVASMLKSGVVVSGASRFRWEGFEADPGELAEVLAGMPSDDPSRAFDGSLCRAMVFVSPTRRYVMDREFGMKRRLFKQPFWVTFLGAIPAPAYGYYIHSEGADLYKLKLTPPVVVALRAAASLMKDPGVARLLAGHGFTAVEFIVPR
jgi:hypothetical protein